jgi:hypothetical protein
MAALQLREYPAQAGTRLSRHEFKELGNSGFKDLLQILKTQTSNLKFLILKSLNR